MQSDLFSPSSFGVHMRSPASMMRLGGPKLLREFADFALHGSMLDLAVGIVLGVAFGRVITSFVDDVFMPPIGMLFGHRDASNLFLSLGGRHFDTLAAARAAGAPTLNYGMFVNTVINFVLVACGVFLLIRQINRLKRLQGSGDSVGLKECEFCCAAIPAKASRCPQCTSMLGSGAAATP